MSLEDKVILITGAAQGIGYNLAKGFAQRDAKIVLTDINLQQAQAAADSLQISNEKLLPLAMNVTDENAVEQSIDEAVNKFGRIDVLINNAGIQHVAPIDQCEFADWKRVMAVHLDGAFLTTRACLRHMYASTNGGSIIYMGSVHSKLASPLKAPYVAAKHGLLGLSRAVAKEGAKHNVRSNVICPGFVRTELVEKQIPQQAADLGISEEEVVKEIMLGNTVTGEFTEAEDITNVALFLADFTSHALTGQSIIVSHGWHME